MLDCYVDHDRGVRRSYPAEAFGQAIRQEAQGKACDGFYTRQNRPLMHRSR